MGRSKFPGKPPKAVTRKRIKVLGRPDTTAPSDSVTVAENIYYGLSLFHGDSEKEHPPFHGFSTNEAKLSVSYMKTQILDAEHDKVTTPAATGEEEKSATNSTRNEKEATSCSDTENRKSKTCRGDKASTKPAATTPAEKIGKKVVVGSNRKASKTKKMAKIPKTPVLKSVNNILDRHQRTRQLRNSTAKRLLQRAKTGGSTARNGQTKTSADAVKFGGNARKFVLPIRSAHSSRVIKPNKRFIEESEGIITRQDHHGDAEGTKGAKKAKVTVAKAKVNESAQEVEEKDGSKGRSKKVEESDDNDSKSLTLGSKNQSQSASAASKQQALDDARCSTAKDLPDTACLSESSRVKTRSGTSASSGKGEEVAGVEKEKMGGKVGLEGEGEQSEWTGMKLSEGKVVLRKARLKLDNKSLGGTEGPFSVVNTQNSMGMSSSIKCGVCGAVRFYRFVKQTRKFGVQSCVSCRKFINKMIKRQACAKSSSSIPPALQCIQGDGLCLMAPVVRNQEWNMSRCAYKTRCHACWLKMCLKFYNIPVVSVKSGLNAMLPQPMRMGGLPVVGQDICDAQNSKLAGKMAWPAEDSLEKNLFKSAWNNMDLGRQKLGCQGTTEGFSSRKFDKISDDHYSISISPNKKRKKDNRMKVGKKMKSPLTGATSPNLNEQTSRQKVELKGPRVKHVCRSASVALGQPLATFPVVDGKDDAETSSIGKNVAKDQDREEDKASKKEETAKDKDQKTGQETTSCNIIVNSQPPVKRGKAQLNTSSSNLLATRASAKASLKPVHTISIDFWEQYDPAEVGAKGFALIASEPFHIPAICYLCGSAGKEPMIHCQCCCEPYHQFCLEPSEWNACSQPNWSCPRCTICQSCHIRSGPKLSCIRCRQSFHHSCLSKSGVSARLYSPDRPYVCQSCVKCKSCGSEGVSVHVGNLPLCSMCFKLRQRGNYCPLCQRCYNENDYDTKMMECNECSCWVHARCEGLSDERYQILSYLPDSIEFTCRQCTTSPNSIWRSAIEAELKAGFIAVIKSLSKNRKACTALQWSPRKECLCRPLASARRLDFSVEKIEPGYQRTRDDDTCGVESNQGQGSKELKSDKKLGPDNEDYYSSANTKMEVEGGTRRVLRRLRYKFHGPKDLESKNLLNNRDAGDGERKNLPSSSGQEEEDYSSQVVKDCNCCDRQVIARPSPTLMSVKRKVNGNEYGSLFQFYCDMEHVISRTEILDLMETYRKTLEEVFPWFDVRESPSGQELDTLSTTTWKESQKSCQASPTSLDDSILLDVWRDEILKAPPKAIAAKTANLLYSGNIQNTEDSRSCCLCKGLSDGLEMKEGRLLYCGQNEWVHANCVLWSNQVFEEMDGSLQNVHSAISRGRMIRCTECGKKGASVGCCSKSCGSTYHFPCARNVGRLLTFNDDDKTIFCVSHSTDNVGKVEGESDFSLKRPVYVELDRKKKKFAEPNTVRVMIGSLTIDCLGTVIPEFSDCVEKIVPSGYKCSRLYWSTVNPWKIVRYYIRTFVQVCVPQVALEIDNNVTIDHSMEHKVKKKSAEFAVVKQLLDTLVDQVCNKEVDESLAEQNNTDLLPPELKEAIFQDLPHDLLDGISMQDIFPKASYEDFLAMDLKNEDLLKEDDILPDSKTMDSNDFLLNLESRNSVQDLVDDIFNSKSHKICSSAREFKRPKSQEVVGNNVKIKSQQPRSCSLTWSCKLDATMKRRKITRSKTWDDALFHEIRIPESIMLAVGGSKSSGPGIIMPQDDKDHKKLVWHARQQPRPILQVDGPADPGWSSSSSECGGGSPEYNMEEERGDDAAIFPVVNSSSQIFKLDRAWEKKFSPIIPQVDGAGDDVSSDEECDDNKSYYLENHPVTCVRCQCTYRTQDSYDRHLYNCEIMTTSDSDSDVTDNKFASSPEAAAAHFDSNCFVVGGGSSPPCNNNRADVQQQQQQVISPLLEAATVPSSPHLVGLQIEPMGQAATTTIITPQQIHAHSTVETLHRTVLTTNDVIVQTQYTRTTTTLPNNTTMLPQENGLQQITDIPETPMLLPGDESCSVVENLYSQEMMPRDQDAAVLLHNSAKPAGGRFLKSSKTPKVRPKLTKTTLSRNTVPQVLSCGVRYQQQQQQQQQQGNPIIQMQQQPRSQPPTVILEQVAATPAPNMVSSYVESLQQQQQQQQQQQSGQQSVQYITAIGNQEAYKPQYIAANHPLVPGAYIHASSENLLALQNGGGGGGGGGLALQNPQILQIAQPQQTVLGTVLGIQQQQPTAIQCGVISSEQLVLSSAPTLGMFTDSTGSMFVSSQPMYYGLETIVSNTVMSSSQFMSGPVPQVLASSYQTTTQVFQASKLMEPLVDVQPISNVQAVPGIPNIPTVSTLSNVPTVTCAQNVASMQPVQGITGNFLLLNQSTPIAAEQLPTAHHQLGILPTQTLEQNFIHAARNPVIPVPTQQPVVEPAKLMQNQEMPNVINYVNPTPQMSCPSKPLQQGGGVPSIPRVAVRPSPIVLQQEPECRTWRYIEPPPEPNKYQVPPDSSLYLDSKRVSENTSMIKSSLSSRIPPLPNHCISQRTVNVDKFRCENPDMVSCVATSMNNVRRSSNSRVNAPCPGVASNKVTMPINNTPTSRPMNRVLPMQVAPKQDTLRIGTVVEKTKIMEEPTKLAQLEEKPLVLEDGVESMQEEKCLEDDGMMEEKIKSIIASSGKWQVQKEKVEQKQGIQQDFKEKPLKIVLQKQFKDGSYKIAQSRASEKNENIISQQQATIVHTTTLPLLPIKKFELKTSKTTSAPKISSSPPPLPSPTPPPPPPPPPSPPSSSPPVMFSKPPFPPAPMTIPKSPSSPSPVVPSKQLTSPFLKPSSPAPITFSKPAPLSSIVFSKPSTPPTINKILTPVTPVTTMRPAMKNNNICLTKIKTPPIAVKKPRLLPKSTPVQQRAHQKQQQQPKKLSKPSLMYEIKSQDGFVHTASSMEEVWDMVFQEVQNARKNHNMPLLPYNPLSGNIGLENNATIYLIEQLPNVNRCTKYTPKFHSLKPPKAGEGEEFMRESELGSARAEPFKGRKVHDMFSWLASRHRQQPKMIPMSETELRRLASTNLPMAMRFRHLKETSKESVGVYHSHIHGRGLFCLRDIEAGEMVIEYAGEVIRSSLTDKREKYYDSKNIGCYMFKIDDHLVIDATMKGNAARFINHSCDPNCYSRVVDILGMKHILIFALRRIIQGEELTYDYKFPFEDIKIPCTCGSRRCRKYLN